MDKKIFLGIFVGIGVLGVLAILSIDSSPDSLEKNNITSSADKVEVFMFHSTQRCPTCIRIGQLTKATLEEKFSEQLNLGKINFKEINIDLPENKILAEKFKASGSALFINSIKNGQDNIEEDVAVWQLAGGSTDKFKDYILNKINNILGI
jgi:hypothetical protein